MINSKIIENFKIENHQLAKLTDQTILWYASQRSSPRPNNVFRFQYNWLFMILWKKYILAIIWGTVSWQCESRSFIGKDSAKRQPLSHGVVFLLFWVLGGIMELKYQKNWTTLLAFTASRQLIDTTCEAWNWKWWTQGPIAYYWIVPPRSPQICN